MLTWSKGRRIVGEQLRKIMPPLHQFIVDLSSNPPTKIDGQAVFLTGTPHTVPVALAKNVKHNRVIHSQTILLHFRVDDIPRVPNSEKIKTEKLGGGFFRIIARYGFMEDFRVDRVLELAREQGLAINRESATFFIGREKLVAGDSPRFSRWRANLFIFMSRNASDAGSFFNLPRDQVIEVGVRLEI
jgi:KUP system potassium uptake protein